MPVITLLNGKKIEYKNIVSLVKVAEDIQPGLSKFALGAIVNNNIIDIKSIIDQNCTVYILTFEDERAFELLKYTYIQLLSYACTKICKGIKIDICSHVEDKIYCNVYFNDTLKGTELLQIQKLIKTLIQRKYNIILKYISYIELKDWFLFNNETYKLEYIKKHFSGYDKIPVYFHEDYLDIYLGPQFPNIKFCSKFKIKINLDICSKIDNSRNIPQTISGLIYSNYVQNIQRSCDMIQNQAKDHRLLNQNMNLYHKQKEAPGMIFWHNNGLIIFKELKKFIRQKLWKWNYEEVNTPLIIHESMWKISGHLDNFKDSMFFITSENQKYCLKPMNCPAHIQIFNKTLKSYRNLPIRMLEFGTCHRNETSGSLYGLLRLKSFTQDDTHIFCTEKQIQDEIMHCINVIIDSYKVFGFKKIHVKFSTRPENRIGNDIIWDKAELSLQTALLNSKIDFVEQAGEGAFYGPKIEFILEDCFNRLWQCGTIQLDFYLPDRFGVQYIDKNNRRKTPIMIHRAILGSLERFIGILLEEYSGYLPIWLSPIQVMVISINSECNQYATNIFEKLVHMNIRAQLNIKNENINLKIKSCILLRVSYILICGNKEMCDNMVSIRKGNNISLKIMHVNSFFQMIQHEVKYRQQ